MSPKRQYNAVIRSMEAKVELLEDELDNVHSSLTVVENPVKDMLVALMAMLEKYLGRSLQASELSVQILKEGWASDKSSETMGEVTRVGSSGAKKNMSPSDVLTKFCHSVRKVELPWFDGNDHAWWIS